jgi:WD40 repeat protein
VFYEMMDEPDDVFRVYSDRQMESSSFVWSPYMDLLAVLPSDSTNPSISIWRLINDKQTGSPLLFTEKIPYTGSTVGWVPDKRSLAVGDTGGNVFVYDAERQRTIELQKVHSTAVTCIDWLDAGEWANEFRLKSLSNIHKLPGIQSVPSCLGEHQLDSNVDNCPVLLNESLSVTNRLTILSVLGQDGNVQIYSGGSIPIGEISIPKLFAHSDSGNFFHIGLSEDMSSLVALSQKDNQLNVFSVNSKLLRFRAKEIGEISYYESMMHWLLIQMNACIDSIGRVVSPIFEEFDSSLGDVVADMDQDFLNAIRGNGSPPAFIKEILGSQQSKISKLTRSMFQALDFHSTHLITRTQVIHDHIALITAELHDVSCCSPRYGLLGLDSTSTQKMLSNLVDGQKYLRALIVHSQRISRILRVIFWWLESIMEDKSETSKLQIPSRDSIDECLAILTEEPNLLARSKSRLCDFEDLLGSYRVVEQEYVSILSRQRRHIGSKLKPEKIVSFPVGSRDIRARFKPDSLSQVELTWVDVPNRLVVATMENRQTHFVAPEGALWKFPRFYRQDRICVLLMHEGQTASICLLKYDSFLAQSGTVEIYSDDYGYPSYWIAQQVPDWYLSATMLEVSGPRGLCSIYTPENGGRIITLDLEGGDDEDEDDGENLSPNESLAASSVVGSSSGEENRVKNVSMESSSDENSNQSGKRLMFDN